MSTQLQKRLDALEGLVKQKQLISKPKQFRIGVFKSGTHQELVGVVDINGVPQQGTEFDTAISEDFLPLLDGKYRFVSMRGGRGSGKSVTVAKILLLQAYHKPLKVLCFREVQNSIKDSVYTSLLDLIDELGLGGFYTYTLNEIRGANGSTFIFKGLSDQTVESIKSFSGIDICWGEEASGLTDRSLNILIPTIRNEGSRFYFTWNPELDTQAVYQRYVLNTREDVKDVEVNYMQNPWFPQVLEVERIADQKRLPEDEYRWMWEGKVLPARIGAIYFRELSTALEAGRVQRVIADPTMPVHQIWDLGWRDQTAIILAQRTLSEVRIVGYLEGDHFTYAQWSEELRAWARTNNIGAWGYTFLPHDGRQGNMQTGQSPEELLLSMGWEVKITQNVALDAGIRSAKQLFPRVFFDTSTQRLIECLRQYHYKERSDGNLGQPVHDDYSHGADAFRYLAVNQELLTTSMQQRSWGAPIPYKKRTVF